MGWVLARFCVLGGLENIEIDGRHFASSFGSPAVHGLDCRGFLGKSGGLFSKLFSLFSH